MHTSLLLKVERRRVSEALERRLCVGSSFVVRHGECGRRGCPGPLSCAQTLVFGCGAGPVGVVLRNIATFVGGCPDYSGRLSANARFTLTWQSCSVRGRG